MAASTFQLKLMWRGRVINSPADRPEGIPVRAWRAILKHVNLAMAIHWHRQFLPRHFGPQAARRYRGAGVYRPRSPRHRQRKDRQRGLAATSDRDYLRFTGELERRVTQEAAFRAFPTRVLIHMPAPLYISRRPRKGQPDIHAELTALNAEELKELRQVGVRALRAAVAEYQSSGILPQGVM